jgi:hypothetical protein
MAKMTQANFLENFEDDQFPEELGPSIGYADHDPPFTISELRRMQKSGLIVLDEARRTYRLTMKATKNHEAAK